jgi:hypothetical protein
MRSFNIALAIAAALTPLPDNPDIRNSLSSRNINLKLSDRAISIGQVSLPPRSLNIYFARTIIEQQTGINTIIVKPNGITPFIGPDIR